MSTLLDVQNLSVQLQSKPLLRELTFSIASGELVGIIGPNGAGKSTLLKTLVGIHPHQLGDIHIQGRSRETLSPLERAKTMSYMAQKQLSAFPFKVSETISLGAFSRTALARSSLDDEAMAIAKNLDVMKLWDRKLDELSGGETQLVHFARILMQRAPLMLLDEPTASLDIGHETQLMNLLKTQCERGTSALVAIHNLNVAAAFCDRLILIDQGELVAQGLPEDVINQQRMRAIYGDSVLVSRHPLTGSVTALPNRVALQTRPHHIHLIGGAGSTVALTRSLLQLGFRVTAGIGHEQDSDTECWESLGVEHVKVPAFSSISEKDVNKAKAFVDQADITLVTEFPIGEMNAGNLNLAAHANNLWVLEESTQVEKRIYSDTLQQQFTDIKNRARILSTQQALVELKNLPVEL